MATAQENRDSDYVSRVRALNRQAWEAIHALLSEQAQWNSLDYLNTLVVPGQDSTHEGITRSDVGAVVFDTAVAFKAVLDAGHGTNMAKLL